MSQVNRSLRPARGRILKVLATALVLSLAVAGAAVATSSRAAVAPGSSSVPTFAGAATVGATLTANPGTWSGSSPLTFQYQWLDCNTTGGACGSIAGATQQSYQLAQSDLGNTIRVQVIASNSDGSASAQSAASTPVGAATSLSATTLPAISGTAAAGSTLTASNGAWNGSTPITYAYQWLSCNTSGASCNSISNATNQTYVPQSSDVGTTVRVEVTATNAAGSATAQSQQSGTILAQTSAGCPVAAAGQTVPAAAISAPALLQVAASSSPSLTAQTQSFSVTFHVTDTCGQPVSGAQVYATAVPYQQFTIPALVTSDGSGNATLSFNREAGYPAAKKQELLVMFVRATRPGDPLLAGISTRRLISLKVNLG